MRVEVRVVPKSSQEKVVKEESGLKVYVRVAPDKGKANKAVIELLAEYYSVRKADVKIISGEKSRNKMVEVSGR